MSQTPFDPYATLGVSRGADAKQLRSAYRRLARDNHPDLTGDRTATERMQRINRAWEILSDPAERARHDAASAARASTTGHWSGAPRRSAQWAPPPQTWSAEAAGAREYGYGPPPSPVAYEDDDGPRWWSIVGVLLLLLLVAPIILAGLGGPAFGLLLLVFGRWATRRLA